MRSGRALAPSLQSGPLSPCTLLASPPRHALTPPSPHLDPTSYALLSTRQNAVSFNQPLSFDISNLENGAMRDTFSVRVPWTPSLESDRLRACRLRRRAPRPPPDPHLAPASYALLSTRHRGQPPCPRITSCSSVARGISSRSSPSMKTLSMTRSGLRETASSLARGTEALILDHTVARNMANVTSTTHEFDRG